MRALAKEDSVRFEVADSGPGIRPEIQSRLFERLFQEEAATSRSGALGLGLYIVKGIAEAHGGRVGVESQLGNGSTFFIELPRVDRSVSRSA